MASSIKGMVFNIQRYSTQDGPGVRTTIFLKGCSLRCAWCSNPESQSPHPQLLYFETLCTRCYRCISACANGATLVGSNGEIFIDRSLCKSCGRCAEACPNEARTVAGKVMGVSEVMEVIKKDALFYRNSGGGVTLSGGEALFQLGFALELARSCQRSGFHCALDTSGYASWEDLETLLDSVDLVLYDIKHMNPQRHLELTGVDNRLILDNLRRLVGMGKETVVRVPLISGYNDSEDNIRALGEFGAELEIRRVDLLPYHRLGASKYQRLGLKYRLDGVELFKRRRIDEIKELLRSYGLDVNII